MGAVREWRQRHERESRGVEQEADRAYQSAIRGPIQIGDEDREALEMVVRRQEQGLSPDQQGLRVGIWRVQQLNIERERDGPDIG